MDESVSVTALIKLLNRGAQRIIRTNTMVDSILDVCMTQYFFDLFFSEIATPKKQLLASLKNKLK